MEFDHKPLLEAAKELVRYDEVERALKLLEQVPAKYRDFPIQEVEDLRRDILAACVTPHAYLTSGLDSDVSEQMAVINLKGLLRGKILIKEMERLPRPHIVDMGPGEYWIPLGLKSLGHAFSYHPLAFDQKAKNAAWGLIESCLQPAPNPGQATIFVCHEVIEHLPSTQDIAIEALRHCGRWPDFVHLSTPLYTFSSNHPDWNKPCGLPHLRAYTPREFIAEAQKLFPGYNWEYATDSIQSLRGYRVGGPILEINK